MVCGGFVCTKNALSALNILYVMVSLLLIGVAAWGKWFGLVSSISVVAGVIGVGVFLLFVAFVGLCGALKHHQVLLFFYMVILFMVFVLQFSISCACLALNTEQQNQLLEVGWNKSESTQMDVEKTLNCCGFSSVNLNQTCPAVSGCSPSAAVLLGPSLSKARLLRCSVASPIPPAPPAPASCRRTPGTCSTSLAASACSSASRRSVGRRANVCARFLQLSEILLVSFRSSESGSLTDTGT
uniref:Tetraspanin-13 n=1 Tax=Oryzias latipes TaxID=8090 RepID=A0A3P9JPS8_ORYLA